MKHFKNIILAFFMSLVLFSSSMATVSSEDTPRVQYTANGITTNFPITFAYASISDVHVYFISNSTGLATAWTKDAAGPTGYTVSAGSIIANTAPSNGYLVAVCETPVTQLVDVKPNRALPADTLEGVFDKLTLIGRDLKGTSSRSLVYGPTYTGSIPYAEDLADEIQQDSVDASVAAVEALTFAASLHIDNIAALRLFPGGETTSIYLDCHTSQLDGGNGPWVWDADSVLADDNGTVVQVTGADVGRWIRQLPGPYVTPEMFGCDSDESTVDNVSFDAALAYWAGQSGLGKIVLGPKKYRLTSWRVGTANQRIIVDGTSTKVESKSAATGGDIGTVIIIDDSVTTVGITLESAACGLKNVTIYGDPGNTADGVQLLGNSTFLDTVTVTGMGGDGIVINHPTLYLGYKVNSNNWLLNNVNARENIGNGVVIDSYHLTVGGSPQGPDANGGTAIHLNCQLNGLNGLVVGHCSVNNFYGLKTESNGNYGVYLAGKGYTQLANVAPTSFSGNNTFHNVHSEGNNSADPAYQFYCGQYAVSNLIYGSPVYAIYDDGQNVVQTIYGSASVKNIYYGTDNFTINSIDAGQSTDTVPYTASNPNAIIKGTSPGITMKETDAGADAKTWALRASSGALSLRTVNDGGVVGDYVFDVTRSGNTVTKTTFPDGKVIFTDGIGVGNGATASSLGPLTHVAPVVDAAGALLGYIPIYGSYTP